MERCTKKLGILKVVTAVPVLGLMLTLAGATSAHAQCGQDPTKVFRSGLWKQWIYWAIPGPTAYAAVVRIVSEVNVARAAAGQPLLVPNPSYEIVASVFEERNARGADGISAYPETTNREAFLATFVDDTAGGFEVLFLTDPLRSNALLTGKGVPGVAASIRRSIEVESEDGREATATKWDVSSVAGDRLEFDVHYPDAAVYYRGIAPRSRTYYAQCNLAPSADVIFRTSPTTTYALFAREESNWVDLSVPGVKAKLRVEHHDPDVSAIFNDPQNVPEVLIGVDRDVRMERR